MKQTLIIYITTSILLFACANSPKSERQVSNSSDSTASLTAHKTNSEDGTSFSDTCACSFDYIGKIKSSEKRFDLVISGKGWNPRYYSCSWTWGELISNEFPPDTNVTDFRIHLVELDKLDDNIYLTFLNSKQFNDNLIATYSMAKGDEYMTCRFDPNKTGKYPKPKQWKE